MLAWQEKCESGDRPDLKAACFPQNFFSLFSLCCLLPGTCHWGQAGWEQGNQRNSSSMGKAPTNFFPEGAVVAHAGSVVQQVPPPHDRPWSRRAGSQLVVFWFLCVGPAGCRGLLALSVSEGIVLHCSWTHSHCRPPKFAFVITRGTDSRVVFDSAVWDGCVLAASTFFQPSARGSLGPPLPLLRHPAIHGKCSCHCACVMHSQLFSIVIPRVKRVGLPRLQN